MNEDKTISHLEFEHFIAEFEALKDTILDDIIDLRQRIEMLKEDIDDLKKEMMSKRQ